MKVKTSELSGRVLCCAVCMIEMPHLVWNKTIGIHHASDQIVVPELPEPKCYSPFMGWDMFGPIIEREGLYLKARNDAKEWKAGALSMNRPDNKPGPLYNGPTPLIAACRCYVASKLGDEIEIPEELK